MTNLTQYPLQQNFETTLSQPLTNSASDLTLYTLAVPSATFPSSTKCIVTLEPQTDREENVLVEAWNSSLKTMTISSAGRAQALGNGVSGTLYSHAVGSKVIISNPYPVYSGIATAIASKADAASPVFTGALKVGSMATTERDALTPANGMIIYNTTTGTYQGYDGGTWDDFEPGSAPSNASETVAGISELATVAEQGTATSTGGTGARLVVANSNLVKTSSGASDENKIGLLGADGGYPEGFLTKAVLKSTATTKGDIYAATGAGAISRLGVGANGLSLIADSTAATGLKYGLPNKTVAILGAPTTLTASTTETTILTGTVAGGAIGALGGVTGKIELSNFGLLTTRTLTVRLKYGATTVVTKTFQTTGSTATGVEGTIHFYLVSNGSTSAQRGHIKGTFTNELNIDSAQGFNWVGTGAGTATEDSTADKTFSITFQFSDTSATNTVTADSGFAHTI